MQVRGTHRFFRAIRSQTAIARRSAVSGDNVRRTACFGLCHGLEFEHVHFRRSFGVIALSLCDTSGDRSARALWAILFAVSCERVNLSALAEQDMSHRSLLSSTRSRVPDGFLSLRQYARTFLSSPCSCFCFRTSHRLVAYLRKQLATCRTRSPTMAERPLLPGYSRELLHSYWHFRFVALCGNCND